MVYTTHCRDMHSLSNWMRSIKEVNAGLAPYKSAKINALTSKLAGRYFY